MPALPACGIIVPNLPFCRLGDGALSTGRNPWSPTRFAAAWEFGDADMPVITINGPIGAGSIAVGQQVDDDQCRQTRQNRAPSQTQCRHYEQLIGENHRKRGPRGYDAGKKVIGRKRHSVVDTGGLLMVVVHPADVPDQDGVRLALPELAGRIPRLQLTWADRGIAVRLRSEYGSDWAADDGAMVIAGYGCFYDHVGRLIVAALSVNDDVGLIGNISFVRFYNALATGLVQQGGDVVVVGNGYAVHQLTVGDAEMARRTIAYHSPPAPRPPTSKFIDRTIAGTPRFGAVGVLCWVHAVAGQPQFAGGVACVATNVPKHIASAGPVSRIRRYYQLIQPLAKP